MEVKGTYKLAYTLDKEPKDLILAVELRLVEGMQKPNRNVWEGVATLNGQQYVEDDLRFTVNAKSAAERIGMRMRDEIKAKAKAEGHVFRIKKEEVK